jgi:NADH-quinone oxidoreductase subunit C
MSIQKRNTPPAGNETAAGDITAPPAVHAVFREAHLRFAVRGLEEKRADQAYLRVDREDTVPLLTYLRDMGGYTHLSFFTAVDRIEDGIFELLYMLHNYELKHDLGVIVRIARDPETGAEGADGEGCRADSIHHLWPAAETYQRELREMFGIDFPGSPRLHEDFALEGWEDIPPMRREFDTREYSERVYYARPGRETHDTRQHMKEKLYPGEAETW